MEPKRIALALAGPLIAAAVVVGSGAINTVAEPLSASHTQFTAGAPAAQQTGTATNTTVAPAAIAVAPGADAESQLLEAIYQKVNPSVVEVVNLAQAGRSLSSNAVPQGEGSGWVWDTQGHIVTNDHVVSGADQLQVILADGTTLDAKLVGTDPNADLAVVQIDPSGLNLVPVQVANSSQVKVGELAVALGNPFGFQNTMTRGIVSAVGRTIPSQTQYSIPEAIQTDAAINPGNSGGPLLDAGGQLIGVNDQIQSASGSNSGVGFAIPSNIVKRVVPALIQNGSYQHSYLGLSGTTFAKSWAQALGLPANAKGVYVEQVAQGGPAANAGLRGGQNDTNVVLGQDQTGTVYLQSGGDLITAVNGQPVTSMDSLLVYMEENTNPGQTVKLSVLRSGGQAATLSVQLGVRPDTTGG